MFNIHAYNNSENSAVLVNKKIFTKGISSRYKKNQLGACIQYSSFLKDQYSNKETLKNKYSYARTQIKLHFYKPYYKERLSVYLSFFTLDKKEIQAIKKSYNKKVIKKNRKLIEIRNEDYVANIDKAIKLLNNDNMLDIIVSLAVITGRRTYEIGCTGIFVPIRNNNHEIGFYGQAKTRKEDKDKKVTFPCYVEAKIVMTALNKLRSLAPELINMDNEVFHNKFSRSIKLRFDKYQFIGINQPKQSRNVYLAYCIKYFKPQNISNNAYASKILGHSEDDIQTASSYMTHVIINRKLNKRKRKLKV